MAVVPLRQSPQVEIVEDPKPDTTQLAQVEVGDDGSVEINIGSNQPARQRKQPAGKDFNRNLAEDLDDTSLMALASYLLEGIEADAEGRQEWEETANQTAAYLGVKLTDPASTVGSDGTVCQAVTTCMLEAAMKLWSTSYAELLPVGGPVKVERQDPVPANQPTPPNGGGGGLSGAVGGVSTSGIDAGGGGGAEPSQPGQDPTTQSDAAGDDLADALERDLNWYLTVGDRGYYPDTSKMLMNRNCIGVAFKEVYRCPIERKPLSRWVMAQDLIVSGCPSHLGAAGRVTVRKKVRQSVMLRMQASGHYRDVPLVHPTGATSNTEIVVGMTAGVSPTPTLPRDFEHTVYESACELGSGTAHDLFGDLEMLDRDEKGRDPGFPLPYRVTIDYDSRTVLAIRRNWKQGDPDYRVRRRFVKYGFIPAFGGGFYDYGLIHLVGNPTQAATMLQRSGVDAALFSNFPAWAIKQGPASKLENTVYRPGPGEGIKIAATGSEKLSDVIMPWPYKEPSAQSMALGQKLESQVKAIAGVVEIPVGEGRIGNTPVGTIMSYIESVSMVPGAVHKLDHMAQAEEFELLRELIAEEPEVLWRGNKNPARKWQVAEELLSPDLAPKADPNTPSQIHRLLKVQGQIMLGGLPQFMGIADNRAIYRHATEVLVGDDAAEYTLPEQPPQAAPPDPKVMAAQIKAESEAQKGVQQQQTAQLKHQGDMAEIAASNQQKDQDAQVELQKESMKLMGTKVKTGADMVTAGVAHAHDAQQAAVDRSHEAGLQLQDHAAAKDQQSADHASQKDQQAADHAQATQQTLMAPDKGSE